MSKKYNKRKPETPTMVIMPVIKPSVKLICVLCSTTAETDGVIQYDLLDSASFKAMLQYVKIATLYLNRRLSKLSSNEQVTICRECRALLDKFLERYRSYEAGRLELNRSLQDIISACKEPQPSCSSEWVPPAHFTFVQIFQQVMGERCNQLLTAQPRVCLEELDVTTADANSRKKKKHSLKDPFRITGVEMNTSNQTLQPVAYAFHAHRMVEETSSRSALRRICARRSEYSTMALLMFERNGRKGNGTKKAGSSRNGNMESSMVITDSQESTSTNGAAGKKKTSKSEVAACEHCGKTYVLSTCLKRHIRLKHKKAVKVVSLNGSMEDLD